MKTILRVRCNESALLPEQPSALARVSTFVGWRRLRRPRYHAVDIALNDSREACGLPVMRQHKMGGVDVWFVPKESATTLRPQTHELLRYYATAIMNGDLIALDELTKQVASVVEDGRLAELEERCTQDD